MHCLRLRLSPTIVLDFISYRTRFSQHWTRPVILVALFPMLGAHSLHILFSPVCPVYNIIDSRLDSQNLRVSEKGPR